MRREKKVNLRLSVKPKVTEKKAFHKTQPSSTDFTGFCVVPFPVKSEQSEKHGTAHAQPNGVRIAAPNLETVTDQPANHKTDEYLGHKVSVH
jgi:hypothetical protein